MKKTVLSLSSALMISGLAGCGANDGALDYQNNGVTFDGENRYKEGNMIGNIDVQNRNTPDMFDQTDAYNFVNDNMNGDRYNRNIYYNNTSDFNYHGQMNTTIQSQPTDSYDDPREAHLAMQISRLVSREDYVNDAKVVIDQDNVYIAVDSDETIGTDLEQRVRHIVEEYTPNKNIQVISDRKF